MAYFGHLLYFLSFKFQNVSRIRKRAWMTIKRPNLNYFILTMKLIWIILQNPRKITATIQKRQQTAFQIHVWRPLQQPPRPQPVPQQRPQQRVQINRRNLTITPVWNFFFVTIISLWRYKYQEQVSNFGIENSPIFLGFP